MRVLINQTNEILEIDGAKLKGSQLRLHRGIYTYCINYTSERIARWAFDNLLKQGYIIADDLYEKKEDILK